MAVERTWLNVSRPLTANGTVNGLIKVANAAGFYVRAKVYLQSTSQTAKVFQVQRVEGSTDIYLGPIGDDLTLRSDVSAYLVADSATVTLYEQQAIRFFMNDVMELVYDHAPVMALRSVLVDEYGRHWGPTNPLPVQLQSGSVQIGTVNAELEVQLSHQDNVPNPGDIHDSVRIGDGVSTITGSTVSSGRYSLDVLPSNALVKKRYNSIVVTARNSDGDPTQIEFRLGTTVVQTVNITYNADGDVDSVVSSI